MGNHHAFYGKTDYKWQCSIAISNYQRVVCQYFGYPGYKGLSSLPSVFPRDLEIVLGCLVFVLNSTIHPMTGVPSFELPIEALISASKWGWGFSKIEVPSTGLTTENPLKIYIWGTIVSGTLMMDQSPTKLQCDWGMIVYQ